MASHGEARRLVYSPTYCKSSPESQLLILACGRGIILDLRKEHWPHHYKFASEIELPWASTRLAVPDNLLASKDRW